MRITLSRENRDAGTESISTCDSRIYYQNQVGNKPGHVSAHIPCSKIYKSWRRNLRAYRQASAYAPLWSTTRSRREANNPDETRYNGIVLLEVSGLSACPKRNFR